MSGYEEIPMESGPLPMLASIFAVPLTPVPRFLRALRSYAGANPLKWLVVVVAVAGYVVAIVIYFAFALLPAVSYVMLIVLTLPFTIAVYAWKGVVLMVSLREGRPAEIAEPSTQVGPAVGRTSAA